MERRTLGKEGFTTSAIGLGCMGFSQGYGPADDAKSLRGIRAAFDTGITHVDTAMTYGQGHNEKLVARAIAEHRGLLEVATKFGIIRGDAGVRVDGRPENIRGYCEASLSRLGIEAIDLYYLHRVDPEVPVAESIGAMANLVSEGKVRYIGVSELTSKQLEQANAAHPVTAVQFEWSLMWREPEDDLIPTARRLGVGLVPFSPLGRGLLTATLGRDDIDTSDFRRPDPRMHGPELDRNLGHVAAMRSIAEPMGITTSQLALAWLLAQGPDVVPLPGSRRLERIVENAQAADVTLDDASLKSIDEAVPRFAWVGNRTGFAVPVTVRSTKL